RYASFICFFLYCSPLQRPLRSSLFPYTTLFRSVEIPFVLTVSEALVALPLTDDPTNRSTVGSNARLKPMAFSSPCATRRTETTRSEEHTSELQSQSNLVCRLLLEKKKNNTKTIQ